MVGAIRQGFKGGFTQQQSYSAATSLRKWTNKWFCSSSPSRAALTPEKYNQKNTTRKIQPNNVNQSQPERTTESQPENLYQKNLTRESRIHLLYHVDFLVVSFIDSLIASLKDYLVVYLIDSLVVFPKDFLVVSLIDSLHFSLTYFISHDSGCISQTLWLYL